MAKLSKFGAAFKAARAAGKKEFEFGGKKYNTKVKGEGGGASKAPKKVPTPTSRQGADAGSGGRATKAAPKSGASRSTAGKVDQAARAKERGAQGPVAPRAVGIAKKGSAISKTVAKKENRPMAKSQAMINEAKKKKERTGGGGGY